MSAPDWYDVVTGAELEQGDVLRACRVPYFVGAMPEAEGDDDLDIDVVVTDLIVLSQTCDLRHRKLENVLLARVLPWKKVVASQPKNEFLKSEKARKALQQGNLPNFALLHERSDPPACAWSVADFHQLYNVPRATLDLHAESIGERLRLRSPYREHVAQAFARYFMRVGLPVDGGSFVKEG